MRVERAGVSQVKERLSMLKRKVAEDSLQPRLSVQEKAAKTVEDYEARISMQIAEVDTMKRRRREEGLARQEEKRIVELETADPEIAALMGFSGFGGGKKTS
jgi:U4/U6.U5 tri-snRNP component SNU23